MSEAIRVVITGAGVLTPLGDSPAALWAQLTSGATAVRDWPDLAAEGYRCARACRIETLAAPPLRRGTALALAAAAQAVTQAGLTPVAGTGVYIGSTLGESEAFEQAASGADVDVATHMVPSFAQALRRRFDLSGPHQAIATACAAGNYAVGAALAALRHGRVDMAIAGGVEPFSRLSMVGFSRSRAMAVDTCRPFDAKRSGMLLGEGAALFLLERADDALRRGAQPLAEVVTLGLSCDAHHPTAPQPDGIGMRAAMQTALDAAALRPQQIDWVNAHGSGTRASDAAEGRALHALFGPALPLVSGSKGALGHALGAASAIELAICLEALRTQTVPPTAGHEQPDAEFGIHCTQQAIRRPLRWVMNNAFAFGGLNSSLLLRAWEM
ncbi:MAG: beta-ketoacyl-[acyl-carrier-protein] synthase family protein [Burkholderiales bacterium]